MMVVVALADAAAVAAFAFSIWPSANLLAAEPKAGDQLIALDHALRGIVRLIFQAQRDHGTRATVDRSRPRR